jgi:drug/metabolite transporter (DMT)-like permease
MPGPPSRQAILARLALLAATLIWGTSFVIIQRALADLPVFHLLACRFTLAALLLLPLAGRALRGVPVSRHREPAGALLQEPADLWGILRDGLTLGGFLFAGFALQTTGLLWTTPSCSAFLTSLAVVMVPPLAWLTAAAAKRRAGAPRS